jgi:hypothetical protein
MSLLGDGGRLGFITPMAILGDDQAADLRKMIFRSGAFTSIDAFPQEDDPDRRIFPEAKMCTAVFTIRKTDDREAREQPFVVRVHPGREIEGCSPAMRQTSAEIPAYDPENLSIVVCSQSDWDLAMKITSGGRMNRLGRFAEFFQGEVNETNERAKGNLATSDAGGVLVTRGACVCLYVTRFASQGRDILLKAPRFLANKSEDAKAWHHRHARVVLQELASRSNVRRLIAAYLAAGNFCNHTINYCPAHKTRFPLELLIGLLNARMSEWFFRLGSTNAHISQYELRNLPCPIIADARRAADGRMLAAAMEALKAGDFGRAFEALRPGVENPPFGLAVRDFIVELVRRIIAIEQARGEIARTERSALDPGAQPLQDLIDRLIYAMGGLTDEEARGLEERLARML